MKLSENSSLEKQPSSVNNTMDGQSLCLQTLRHQINIILVLVALGVFSLAACEKEEKKAIKSTNISADANNNVPNFDRSELQAILQQKIESFGEIVYPESYDPGNPNLYLIANSHPKNGNQEYQNLYVVQDNNLEIMKILISHGVRYQFLEGIESGLEISHNKRYQINEDAQKAQQRFQTTGQITRANMLAEAIYGDELNSIGADDSPQNISKMTRTINKLERTHLAKAYVTIVFEISSYLGLDVDFNQMWQDKSYYDTKVSALRNVVSSLSQDEIDQLVETFVLTNEDYQKYLDASADYGYYRIQGRNNIMAERINGVKSDALFSIGSLHIEHLSTQIKKHNVIIIIPKGTKKYDEHLFFSNYTLEDYKKKLVEQHLYDIGLGDMPEEHL